MTGISGCPPVIVLWLILHIITAINQPVNISDYSHLHRGGNGEKRQRETNEKWRCRRDDKIIYSKKQTYCVLSWSLCPAELDVCELVSFACRY